MSCKRKVSRESFQNSKRELLGELSQAAYRVKESCLEIFRKKITDQRERQ